MIDEAHPSGPMSGTGRSSSSALRAQEDEVADYGDGGSNSPTEDRQVIDDAALTIMSIQHIFKDLSLPEKFRILGLRDVEAPSPFRTYLTACSTLEGREPGMLEHQTRETHRGRLPYPPPAPGSHALHALHLKISSAITPQRTTTAASERPFYTASRKFSNLDTCLSRDDSRGTNCAGNAGM